MGKMVKTSQSYCRGCMYSSAPGTSYTLCMYYEMTGLHRNCEVGYCDKFEKFERKEEHREWGMR